MELKLPKDFNAQDVLEYTGFALGFSFSTFKEVSDYFLFDFPITQVNQYIYTFVLLSTLAIAVKRIISWVLKSNKSKS